VFGAIRTIFFVIIFILLGFATALLLLILYVGI
jgi:hypothetical protein